MLLSFEKVNLSCISSTMFRSSSLNILGLGVHEDLEKCCSLCFLGGLDLAIEGPSKAEISCIDNKDGTCTVTYLPTLPGNYSILVKYNDKHIPGSPFTAKITGIKFRLLGEAAKSVSWPLVAQGAWFVSGKWSPPTCSAFNVLISVTHLSVFPQMITEEGPKLSLDLLLSFCWISTRLISVSWQLALKPHQVVMSLVFWRGCPTTTLVSPNSHHLRAA